MNEMKIYITNDPYKKDELLATWDKGHQTAVFATPEEVRNYFIGLYWKPVFVWKVDFNATLPEYEEVKTELKRRRENVKHFTREFFETYKECNQAAETARAKNETEKHAYQKKGENFKRYHFWDKIYNSDFYNLNSCAYCEFLSIIF